MLEHDQCVMAQTMSQVEEGSWGNGIEGELRQGLYCYCLRTFGSGLILVCNDLIFHQFAISRTLDCRIVHKYFFSVRRKNESVALRLVEPFDLAGVHLGMYPFVIALNRAGVSHYQAELVLIPIQIILIIEQPVECGSRSFEEWRE